MTDNDGGPRKGVFIYLDATTKRGLKVYCAKHAKSMSQVILGCVRRLLRKEPPEEEAIMEQPVIPEVPEPSGENQGSPENR